MHEGHRSRLVGKVKRGDNLYEHELLEVLLFNACPRKNVNKIAHNLIDECGGIAEVLKADPSKLVKVKGVGQSMAEYLVCLGKCLERKGNGTSFFVANCIEQFKRFLSIRFANVQGERFELFCVDTDGRIRRVCPVPEGGNAEKRISIDDVLKIISIYKPHGMYAAHYRAEGDTLPSDGDDNAVATIKFACTLSGVNLYDYCIAARGEEIFSYRVSDRLEEFARKPGLTPGGQVGAHGRG